MKVVCIKDNLLKGIQVVERVVGKNVSLPVLGNVLIETDGGRVKLSSTNLEVGISCWVGGKIEQEGKTTVPVRILSGLIAGLKGERVELILEKGIVKVKGEGLESEVKTVDPAEFPLIPQPEGETLWKVEAAAIQKAIGKVVGACATSESRPEIAGVFLHEKDGSIRVVATDSYRLAEGKIKIEEKNEIKVILPQGTAAEVARVAGEAEGECEVVANENQILFRFSNISLVSRLVEGKYPDYLQIIPKEAQNKAILDREELIRAVRSISWFADQKTNDVKISFDKAGNKIKATAISSETGKGEVEVKGEMSGGDVEAVFNHRYLLEGLGNIEGKEIEFWVNSAGEPGVLRGKGSDDYLYVVMPINL